METLKPNLEKIKNIAWALSLASGEQCLDIPGEYTWAYPGSINKKNTDFNDIRQRFKSIFSSGNSIKDPELIDFIQNCQLNKFLLDPWAVKMFEERWVEWLKESNKQTYNLENLELFKNLCYSHGTQESFLNFYIMNRHKRFRVFKGEYWWHMDIWTKLKYNWEFVENDDIKENDICIVSYPFALYGTKHEKFDWLTEQCEKVGTEILVDFIYLPNSMNKTVNLDLSASCINQITFSLSKTFPVQCAKIAIRLSKTKLRDPMQVSNDENISNRISAGLGTEIMNKFPINYMVKKYQKLQLEWCKKLNLQPTNVVHFAIGESYYEKDNTEENFCSSFNVQDNRYNLGMLYENQNLLKKYRFI